MPEEINRVLTDAISDALFVTEPSGMENLRREGVAEQRIHWVGNVMVDALIQHRAKAEQSPILADLGLEPKRYAVVTLHRPSNVDDSDVLGGILRALSTIAEDMTVVFPVHPRTQRNLQAVSGENDLGEKSGVRLIEPLGYLDFMKLMAHSALVLTDSGGIQEETTILGVPCLTLRGSTERPITITQGTNRLAGNGSEDILKAYHEIRRNPPRGRIPELWDGQAAQRIVHYLTNGPGGDVRFLGAARVQTANLAAACGAQG
jgi:UDP-N-acetylglucosamine 2-epimerase (non-hydrolysing)